MSASPHPDHTPGSAVRNQVVSGVDRDTAHVLITARADLGRLNASGGVAYLAHPVSGETSPARALRWLAWAAAQTPDVAVIAPWLAHICAGADDSDPAMRARYLEHDLRVVRRCDAIILCGGRVSSGMQLEMTEAIAVGVRVLDLTNLGDEPPEAM